MRPGPAAVCAGTVMHHRTRPVDHRFTYPVSYVWLDPDHPDHLTDHHPLWSSRRPAPAWFRRRDHLDGTAAPLGSAVLALTQRTIGRRPAGAIRMLTQVRTWGWLFNPITIYLLWDEPTDPPTAAVLEVTNTPWKERHLYSVALAPAGAALGAIFDKHLHVSPFLDERHRYRLRVLSGRTGRQERTATSPRLVVELDVIDRIQNGRSDEVLDENQPSTTEADRPILRTRLVVDRVPATRSALTSALVRNPLSTHRVSVGIHHQALRLWRAGVPFVQHPAKRGQPEGPTPAEPAGR